MSRALEDLWRELASRGTAPVYLRIDDQHPLDLYAGLDVDGEKLLVLLTKTEPAVLTKRYHAFDVHSHLRQDGRWALNMRLRKAEFRRIFAHLCEDLIEASRVGCANTDGTGFVLDRISRWERLLARDRSWLLDESGLRGLIGELIFLEKCAIPVKGVRAAVEAWQGPLDAEQDFHFSDRLVEVKSCGGGSSKVVISSAEQLDVYNARLYLSVVSLESSPDGPEGSFHLPGLVLRLKDVLRNDADRLALFEERLAVAGYAERKEYEDRIFVVQGIRHYLVEPGFPRLRRSEMPRAIGATHYELDVSMCDVFQRSSCFE